MAYLTEIRSEWRALTAAFVGLGAGLGYTATTATVFAPRLIDEFKWTAAEFARTQSLVLVMLIAIPLAGRLADTIGVRRTATIGVIFLPLSFIALTFMTGDITQYFIIFFLQSLLCATTTSTVYSRIIVHHFRNARGLALALGASGPGLAAISVTLFLNEFVASSGWRAGYYLLAAFTFVGGCIALMMMPRSPAIAQTSAVARPRRDWSDYRIIFTMPVFWLLILALMLCNMPQVVALSQLNLIMPENGVSGTAITRMLGAYAAGLLIGRFLCGLALDRLPTNIVSAIGLGLPAIGLFLIASPLDNYWLLTGAVLFLGLSYGAEGDILGYMVARVFGLQVYSTVLGMLSASISISIGLSSFILAQTLDATGNYVAFLLIAGTCVLIGALILLVVLGRPRTQAFSDGDLAVPTEH